MIILCDSKGIYSSSFDPGDDLLAAEDEPLVRRHRAVAILVDGGEYCSSVLRGGVGVREPDSAIDRG